MREEWHKDIEKIVKGRYIDKLNVVGEMVAGRAIELAPVHRIAGGTLKNSITWKVDEEDLVVRIGTNVEYAPYVEFGTGEKAENGKGKKGWPGMKPQPYLRPALIESKKEIIEVLKK